MFRLLCAVALAGATSDSVLDNAVAWMKENGAEVLDTTQHCIAAAKTAAVLHSKCGQVFNPEGWAAFAAWGALESLKYMHNPLALQLQNSSWIKSSKEVAIKAFQEKTYNSMQQFCGQPDCVNNLQAMENEYGTCYGGTVCASMSSNFVYAKCKAAMEEFLPAAMHSQENSACAMDGEFYCAQQTASIIMKNPKCFAFFRMPAGPPESCAPECVDLWKSEKAEHPACMKIFAGQIKENGILMQTLVKQLILANINEEAQKAAESIDTNVTTFEDVCINGQKLMVV